jgi:phosphoglycolate phosphatase
VTPRIPLCVLFDLDGTLLDSLPGIVFSINHACRAVGLPEPLIDLRSLLGPPIRAILATAAPAADAALLDRLEAAFRSIYDSEGWQMASCFPGARDALHALKAGGHRLFVVSNKPRHIALRSLERESLLPVFERIYTRDSRRPPYTSKSEILQSLLADHQLSPSDCLMVGDTMDDINASAANQIAAAFMEHGYGQLSADVPVSFRLRSFADFLPSLSMENAE